MKTEKSSSKDKKDEKDILGDRPGKNESLIVGIGASAGGIQALQEFFKEVPADSGMAYVVILHLSPDHDSQLASVLQRVAAIPVTEVREKVHIQRNHVYVVPPNRHLIMQDGHIIVSPNTQIEDRRAPVDIFLRTLADEHGPRAIAVILSGTGANGSMGLKRIKERGGATFVQNPREAEFNEMPRNAIATELVDEVLNVAEIPAKIMAYKASLGIVHITEEVHTRSEKQQQALREIFTQVRVHTGHDFMNYKRPTLLRRIERRINIRNLPDLPSYVNFLKEHPDEINALMKDLLISVTNFFRDKKSFDVIEHEVLPVLLTGKKADDQLRIWVAGCATGEEAYSIAMLCAEKLAGNFDAPKVQIFATDIDESSISQARDGYYTLNDAADVSPERLQQFFTKEHDGYRIRREIRDTIMFANHNFLKDPPFSHLDMVTCRNVMIYLNPVAQERVVETFHFALNPGGYLFLGTSESVDGAADLYAVFNRENHIFQSRHVNVRTYPVPESTSHLHIRQPASLLTSQESENTIPDRISFGDLHQQLLEEYAPPSLVINEEYDIIHLTEKAGRYLQIAGGELSKNLLKLVKPELRLELRSALYQAAQRRSAVEVRGLKVSIADKTETINIHVRPVLRAGDTAKGFILVLFEQTADEGRQEILLSSDEPVAKQLEEELVRLKAHLRSSGEQHEFQSEELKASNEELQAMNEELRSAAEELETSKEELQSINEELRTVNQELKIKIEEINITGNNLNNLINSTNIGTIFLDRSFRIVLFTPAASEIFNLIPADYGRPISDITSRLEHETLLNDAETVLEKLNTVEREVSIKDGKAYLMRTQPYRTNEDRIKGVVITFVDVTESRKIQQALSITEQRLQRMVNIPKVGVLTFNYAGTMLHANDAFLDMIGYTREKFNAHEFSWRDFTPTEYEAVSLRMLEQIKKTGCGGPYEKEYIRRDGTRIWLMFVSADLGDGTLVEYAVDISESKMVQGALRTSEERLQLALYSAKMGTFVYHVQEDEAESDEQMLTLFGLLPGETLNLAKALSELIHPDDRQPYADAVAQAVNPAGDGKLNEDIRVIHPDGSLHWVNVTAQAQFEGSPAVATIMPGVCIDITARKQAEESLRTSEERLRALIENLPGCAVFVVNKDLQYILAEGEALLSAGFVPGDITGKTVSEVVPENLREHYVSRYQKALLGNPFNEEHQAHNRTFISRGVPLINTSGNVYAVLAISYDITERKNAEVALSTSEERLRATMESAVDFTIITMNNERIIEQWNTGAERIFGFKAEEVKGKSADIIFTDEDRATGEPEKEMQTAKEKGYAEDERWHQRKDGSRLYMSGVMRAIYNPGLTGYVKIARDMTQQQQAQEQLRVFEERNRVALQSAEMASWDWNIRQDTIVWNKQHHLILGLKPDDKEKHEAYFIRFVHPDDKERIEKLLIEAVENTGVYKAEFRIIRADNNEIRWMNGFGRAIEWEGKQAVRMVGVMFDITDRKNLEQQKEDFIGIASHELKTPVTSIKAYAELLEEMCEDGDYEAGAPLVKKLNIQIDRLVELIHALLDTTKIDAGHLVLNLEEFDLYKLAEERAEEIQRISPEHYIKVLECEKIIITADKERINQVLINLISNAVKYSPKGGDVIINCSATRETAEVSVHDKGIGISKEAQQKVFERFFRVKNAQINTYPGMGLGLYITANIIYRHSGKIWVESKPGEGSVFYFNIPKQPKYN